MLLIILYLVIQKRIFLIYDFLEEKKIKYWIFGDGTNLILKNNLKGLVIKNNLKGFSVNGNSVIVSAGENWDDVVSKSLKKNLYGLENKKKITLEAKNKFQRWDKIKF